MDADTWVHPPELWTARIKGCVRVRRGALVV